jgi:hypothetical protein
MPREMQRFSSKLYSRGCCWRVTSSPPVTASIMFWWKKYAITIHSAAAIVA